MAQTVLITLTSAGADTGPFDLYSDADGFAVPFETGVSKVALQGGYLSVLVPDAATQIRVQSDSVCTNFSDLSIQTTTTTTSTSTSTTTTTTSSTTTTTTSTSTSTTTTTTTAAPPNSASFGSDNASANACAAIGISPETLYWTGVFGIGTILYDNVGLTIPHTGWDFVAYNPGGGNQYFSINNATGQITSSGTPC